MYININNNALFRVDSLTLDRLRPLISYETQQPTKEIERTSKPIMKVKLDVKNIKDYTKLTYSLPTVPINELSKLGLSKVNNEKNALFSIEYSVLESVNWNKIYELKPLTKTTKEIVDGSSKDLNKSIPLDTISRNQLNTLIQFINLIPYGQLYRITNFSKEKDNEAEKIDIKINSHSEEILSITADERPIRKMSPRLKKAKGTSGFVDALIFSGIIGFSIGLILMSILAFIRL